MNKTFMHTEFHSLPHIQFSRWREEPVPHIYSVKLVHLLLWDQLFFLKKCEIFYDK